MFSRIGFNSNLVTRKLILANKQQSIAATPEIKEVEIIKPKTIKRTKKNNSSDETMVPKVKRVRKKKTD